MNSIHQADKLEERGTSVYLGLITVFFYKYYKLYSSYRSSIVNNNIDRSLILENI